VVADVRTRSDRDVGIQNGACANVRALTDADKRADGGVWRDERGAGNIGEPMDAGLYRSGRSENLDRASERQIGIGALEPGARYVVGTLAHDDGRRPRGSQLPAVLRIREERHIAGSGTLEAGDTRDLDVAVAVEATFQAFRKLVQLQRERV
jgi:hypothetical protein